MRGAGAERINESLYYLHLPSRNNAKRKWYESYSVSNLAQIYN